ncbi:MAG TPA: hypothetical protein VGW10_19450, partial [Solirubrobacteraceae bacterium]|nr:hypothetical protein [Solirubrobacteraceae bacterium]
MNTKTYRGRSLEELLPKVRAELGPDAVIVRQREGLTGGVGGFFQKKLVEIEAAAPEGAAPASDASDSTDAAMTREAGRFGVDVRDDSPATPDFLAELSRAEEAVEAAEFVPIDLPDVVEDETWSGWRDDVPAPAMTPFVIDQTPATEHERAWHRNVDVPGTEVVAPFPAAAPRAPLPSRWPAEASTLRDALVARGVEHALADDVVEETVTPLVPLRSGAKLRPLLIAALAQRIPIRALGGLAGRGVAFVGPGGSGKTHCAARLAGAY